MISPFQHKAIHLLYHKTDKLPVDPVMYSEWFQSGRRLTLAAKIQNRKELAGVNRNSPCEKLNIFESPNII